jgi:hypothetical protein
MQRIGAGSRARLIGVAILLAITSHADGSPITVFNGDVNEWSSSTVPDPGAGIYPIGGSGQVNGGFVVTTGSDGAQIGLRAELRGIGLLPQTNNGVSATYFAPAGTSGGNLALWNFDVDIDLRGTGHTISDYSAILTVTAPGGLITPVDLVASDLVPSNAVLSQNSENPGFSFLSSVFPSFDPTAPGQYSFDLTLTPVTFTGDTLNAAINVDVVTVPEPGSAVLALSAGIVVLFSRGRRRSAALKA